MLILFLAILFSSYDCPNIDHDRVNLEQCVEYTLHVLLGNQDAT